MNRQAKHNDELDVNPDPGEVSSAGRDWSKSHSLDLYKPRKQFSADFPTVANYLIAYMTAGCGRLEQVRGQRQHSALLHADDMLIRPAFQPAIWRGDPPAHIRLRLSAHCMEQAWQELGTLPCRSLEIPSVFKARDPFLAQLFPIFQAELLAPAHPAQKLLIQATTSLVIAHLIRKYCIFAARSEPRGMRLAPHLVTRVREYIEDNIAMTITLGDLAQIAGVSTFHLCRSFRASTGFTPMRFVERARIRRAQTLIQQARFPLRVIACMVGFKDQSHFTRRFQTLTGCTPSRFARNVYRGKESDCQGIQSQP